MGFERTRRCDLQIYFTDSSMPLVVRNVCHFANEGGMLRVITADDAPTQWWPLDRIFNVREISRKDEVYTGPKKNSEMKIGEPIVYTHLHAEDILNLFAKAMEEDSEECCENECSNEDESEKNSKPCSDPYYSCFNFGSAVEHIKRGGKVSRVGWNGKGMYLYYVPAASYPAQRNENGTMLGEFPDDMVPYQAYIAMKTAQNMVVPWLASQSDMLGNDWFAVE